MYNLNSNQAKAADTTSNRISETGKYKGVFTRAEHIVSTRTGTQGIDFDFESDAGQKARFSIYTLKSDGKQIYGFKQLMAIMTCLQVKQLPDPVEVEGTVWNNETRKEEKRSLPQFPGLLNKPIGVLLTMEEYQKSNSTDTAWRPALSFVFDAKTELVASEILDRKTQPQQLEKMIVSLRDKPLKKQSGHASATHQPAGSVADMDDDDSIPF